MKAALSIVGGAFKDVWGDIWTMLVCNLLWLLANLLVIPGPPATLALVHYTNRLAHGEVADFSDFWEAFRGYWGPAWRWGAVNLGVVAFLLGDLSFNQPVRSRTMAAIFARSLPGTIGSLAGCSVFCPTIPI